MTEIGGRVGTLPYMAPEQIEGREADTRSDIFAFGSILYEMTTGRRAFAGETPTQVITAILEHEPAPMADAASGVPAALERIVRGCLAKDPDDRIQDARDVFWLLRWTAEPKDGARAQRRSDTPPIKRRRIVQVIAAAAVAGLAMTGAYVAGRQRTPPASDTAVRRFQIAVNAPIRDVTVSPDGRLIAYVAAPEREPAAIWIRSLDRLQPDKLSGTEHTTGGLFWSPDSRFLAFTAGGRLRKIEVAGGAP
jgi:serine/threonine-protein kinase